MARERRRLASGPVVLEARGVSKTFRVPDRKVDSLKERATHPLARPSFRTLRAVDDVSFDVRQGEFFGIVGRNGSGKSTLLKILASVYRADTGRVRMAGRVAPFIELGVGFNPELAARDNVVLNGLLMGLGRREAAERFDAIIDFAELRDVIDLKIKNYSSGMMVRLAFAIMVQADADVMLIDEVLAVGDAAFAQKCMDVFAERRRAGRTIVLVTHDMSTVQSMCHRAMLLDSGRLQAIGEPEHIAAEYYRRNFGDDGRVADDGPRALHASNARLVRAQLLDEAGLASGPLDPDAPLRIDLAFEAMEELDDPTFGIQVLSEDGVVIYELLRTLDGHVAAGGLMEVAGSVDHRLRPGRYALNCWIRRFDAAGDMHVQPLRVLRFEVGGEVVGTGLLTPAGADVRAFTVQAARAS